MVTPEIGRVVIVPFPFSDLTQSKLRPAVVLADAGRGDWILCQVTSNHYGDSNAVEINNACFTSGSLRIVSYARPGKLFTASHGLMVNQAGDLNSECLNKILESVTNLLRYSLKKDPP